MTALPKIATLDDATKLSLAVNALSRHVKKYAQNRSQLSSADTKLTANREKLLTLITHGEMKLSKIHPDPNTPTRQNLATILATLRCNLETLPRHTPYLAIAKPNVSPSSSESAFDTTAPNNEDHDEWCKEGTFQPYFGSEIDNDIDSISLTEPTNDSTIEWCNEKSFHPITDEDIDLLEVEINKGLPRRIHPLQFDNAKQKVCVAA